MSNNPTWFQTDSTPRDSNNYRTWTSGESSSQSRPTYPAYADPASTSPFGYATVGPSSAVGPFNPNTADNPALALPAGTVKHTTITHTYRRRSPPQEAVAAPLDPPPSYTERPESHPEQRYKTDHPAPVPTVVSPPVIIRQYESQYRGGIWCPTCQTSVDPIVKRYPGAAAFFLAVLLLIVFWPLFWLPLVVAACHDKRYKCPYCRKTILVSSE